MSEADPEQETIETVRRTFSVAFMAAAQAGERWSRRREQEIREAEAASVQRAQELRQRLEAEKSTARAVTAQSRRPEFWEHATPADIARAYETAVAWAPADPGIDTDRRAIAAEVNKRYGVDVSDLSALATARHQDAVDHAEATQAQVETVAARQSRDAALTTLDPNNGTDSDEQAHSAAEGAYDSAEARAGRAAAMRDSGLDEAAVTSYAYTDLGQAKPITDAVSSPPARAASGPTVAKGKGLTTQHTPRIGS